MGDTVDVIMQVLKALRDDHGFSEPQIRRFLHASMRPGRNVIRNPRRPVALFGPTEG
jgi:hypothetical protein